MLGILTNGPTWGIWEEGGGGEKKRKKKKKKLVMTNVVLVNDLGNNLELKFWFFLFIFWRTSIVVLLTIPYTYETFNYGALTQKNWSLLWCQTKSTSMCLYTQLNKIKIGKILVYLANTQCLNFFLNMFSDNYVQLI